MDSIIILPRPTSARDLWATLSTYFERNEAILEPDSNVIFNDFEDEEKEPMTASSGEEAAHSILSWPGLGGTEYSIHGCQIMVFLHGAAGHQVDYVTLSLSDGAYSRNANARLAFDRMSDNLHELLDAKRTICGFELLAPGSWVETEVERVRRDSFEGKYAKDLRRHVSPATAPNNESGS